MSISVKTFNVPENFSFRVELSTSCENNLNYIHNYYKTNGIHINKDSGSTTLLDSGRHNIGGTNVFIINQSKQGYMYYYFESIEDYYVLYNHIGDKMITKKKLVSNPVYRYTPRSGWVLCEQYNTKSSEEDVFGYDDYISQIYKDISNHQKYCTFLKEIGEVRSINYLLYGPPGTGKTSTIKAIASKLNCAVFIVNAGDISINNIVNVLSPQTVEHKDKTKILLFEDFDRFLGFDKVETVISGILNALDGFDDKGDTVRFFTANNVELIINNSALINRMSAKYEYHYPDIDIFRKKLYRLLSFYNNEILETNKDKIEEFIKLAHNKKITVRPFVNYIIRYLFDEDFIDNMIKNIDQLN